MAANFEDRKANANPTKTFFVNMLTRDITLEDCILDLIDNSVDSAWRSEGSRPAGLSEDTDLSKYSIYITVSPDRFSIRDDCGGMTLNDAIDHAFSFGRQARDEPAAYSIGVYGIGMKRAVFKLGGQIYVRSTYQDKNRERLSFAVPIAVSEWLKNDSPPWDFDIVEAAALDRNGLEIVVENLTSSALISFSSPAFIQNLRRTIARDYSLHLNRGLKIFLNELEIKGWQIELARSEKFAPMRQKYIDNVGGDEVIVEIIGGMAAPPPESIEPQEDDEGDKRFGWYVACNGRIVLAADKTSVSGWGTEEWPQWHRQYSGFIGIVLFTAGKASSLPLTTTKRSVDITSEIYRHARPYMREVSKDWIAYTNVRKQALEKAKEVELETKPVSINKIEYRSSIMTPKLVPQPPGTLANINYSVSIPRLKALAKELGNINMTYRDIGLRSFNYTYTDLVGEE